MNVNGDELYFVEKLAWIAFPGIFIYVIVGQGRRALRLYGRRPRK